MSLEEYFGDWLKVIDKKILYETINILNTTDFSTLCPIYNNIFNCFSICNLSDLKVVILGMSPYSQLNKATGIAFGNKRETLDEDLSPSLQIIKESVINYEIPQNSVIFDPSFEDWEKQGVLMLNCALTCKVGLPSSHLGLWRPFISKLIYNMSRYMTACVYVLFGEEAKTFEPYISQYNYVIKEKHPSYYARNHKKLRYNLWDEINSHLNNKIQFKR